MKYVRTKEHKIIKIDEKGCIKQFNSKLYAFRDKTFAYRYENGQEVVKQADTIEELCDRYVLSDIDIIFLNKDKTQYRFENEYTWYYITKNELRKGIYGAIWTDKGLIYVAKMNDKGELELL